MPLPDEFEHQWAEWMAEEGLDMEDQIQASIKDSAHCLDMRDGTHGQWDGDELGVLIVFDEQEVRKLLHSWEEAADGNIMAIFQLMHWMEGVSMFLSDCIRSRES